MFKDLYARKLEGNLLVYSFIASLCCLCMGFRIGGFVFAIGIIVLQRNVLLDFISKKNLLLLSLMPLFLFSRVLSRSPHQLIYLKIGIACVVYYLAAIIVFKKAKINFIKVLVSLIFVVFFASFLWTLFESPFILIQRKIFEYPFFDFIEWGPTYIYYSLPIIGMSAFYLFRGNWLFVFMSQLMIFSSVFWGVRGAILAFAASCVGLVIEKKITGKSFIAIALNCLLFAIYVLLNRTILSFDALAARFFIDKPSVLRSWDSPRLRLFGDVSKTEFWTKNLFGGEFTGFSALEFKENPHNILIQTYWSAGIVSFVLLLLIWFLLFKNSRSAEQKVVSAAFFISFSLNIYTTWFFILFLIYYVYVLFQGPRFIEAEG